MTTVDPDRPDALRFLAEFLAGKAMAVTVAPHGEVAHTDGRSIFVSAGRSLPDHRREVLVQSALLGAGSLDDAVAKVLRTRPVLTRRYLAVEGRRVLAELAVQLPLAAAVLPGGAPSTANIGESLAVAKSRTKIDDPPRWFGVIKPSELLKAGTPTGRPATDSDLRLEFKPTSTPEVDEDDDQGAFGDSRILKLLENPLFNAQALADYFRRLFGGGRTPGNATAGAYMQIRSVRRVSSAGAQARPVPSRLTSTDTDAAAACGVWYPEWDVYRNRYRHQWCRVIDYPMITTAALANADVPTDEVLRGRLSRIGLGPRLVHGRPDGDDLDTTAIVDMFVDVRSGHSPNEHFYTERRLIARNLGVLILIDASGSTTDAAPGGVVVHDQQRRAAATLGATLEDLGDRVAIYAFHSQGRQAVHLPAIKRFDQCFGAIERARLRELQPSGYTRLGAAIRAAGEIIKAEAGTPHRLLVVLSDGYPYDHDYQGRYAEADTNKALQELRANGVACLCLSLGAASRSDPLPRVFGDTGHATARTLADLSPRMDALILSALRELSVPA